MGRRYTVCAGRRPRRNGCGLPGGLVGSAAPDADRSPLRASLAGRRLLPVELPAPLRRASHVLDEQARRAALSSLHLRHPGLVVPLAARLRDPSPRAPRLRRHRARSPRARILFERLHDDVGDRAALRGSPRPDVLAGAALPRGLSRLAADRPPRLLVGDPPRPGHRVDAPLSLAPPRLVPLPPPSDPPA